MAPWGPHPGQEELCRSLSILELRIRYDSKVWYDESLRKKKKTINPKEKTIFYSNNNFFFFINRSVA